MSCSAISPCLSLPRRAESFSPTGNVKTVLCWRTALGLLVSTSAPAAVSALLFLQQSAISSRRTFPIGWCSSYYEVIGDSIAAAAAAATCLCPPSRQPQRRSAARHERGRLARCAPLLPRHSTSCAHPVSEQVPVKHHDQQHSQHRRQCQQGLFAHSSRAVLGRLTFRVHASHEYAARTACWRWHVHTGGHRWWVRL